ncbi:hypothetical protein AB0D13_33450 [Streptomyces sp. NPDC048430]|uniref:hypothetical protein n=1 Tax=Streptomyces sp. NPDC048430 TaxID=3155388 RepID=UPI00342D4F81
MVEVRIGAQVPTRELAITGGIGMAPLLDFARRDEQLGYDALWAGDSLVARTRLDPFVVLSAAVACSPAPPGSTTAGCRSCPPRRRTARRGRACRTRSARAVGSPVPSHPVCTRRLSIDLDTAKAQQALDEYLQAYHRQPLAVMSYVQAYGYGSADDCAEWPAGYVRVGARHIVIRIGALEPGDQLEHLATAVLPAVRATIEKE